MLENWNQNFWIQNFILNFKFELQSLKSMEIYEFKFMNFNLLTQTPSLYEPKQYDHNLLVTKSLVTILHEKQ